MFYYERQCELIMNACKHQQRMLNDTMEQYLTASSWYFLLLIVTVGFFGDKLSARISSCPLLGGAWRWLVRYPRALTYAGYWVYDSDSDSIETVGHLEYKFGGPRKAKCSTEHLGTTIWPLLLRFTCTPRSPEELQQQSTLLSFLCSTRPPLSFITMKCCRILFYFYQTIRLDEKSIQ